MKNNIVLNTDSYKVSMFLQYPPQTQSVYSYVESRGGDYNNAILFGLQAYIKQYLSTPVTHEDVTEAKEIWTAHGLPFNEEGWRYIVDKHDGKLPVKIRALPEGTRVPERVPMLTIENTDEECFWLTTWLETSLLRAIWYPTTVATVSNNVRRNILAMLEKTGTPEEIDLKLHDFGARGVSSTESAAIGGAAHLLSFNGTDTINGVLFLREFYGADMPGISIPASEHSTMTSWGRYNEADAYSNMIEQFKANGIFACVSDSYDIFNAASEIWGKELKEAVVNSGAVVVVRPDSGEPVSVVIQLIEILGERFGYTMNDKGYKVLNNVRIIQGDGCTPETIMDIMLKLEFMGWSIDNIAFGMGGGLLQQLDRDTLRFALKCSAIKIGDAWFDVSKNPVTDPGKSSKAGRVVAVRDSRGNLTSGLLGVGEDVMVDVYENGELLLDENLDAVRGRARAV